MDDAHIGRAVRAVRVKARQRQADVAAASGVPRSAVIALERGSLDNLRLGDMRAVTTSLGMRLDVAVRWQGADLDRLMNAGHAAMHESLARMFAALPEWTAIPEVSFSIFGERGVIDIVAWHAPTRSLLLVELKTSLGDPQELVGTMDRRMRLAHRIVVDRDWKPVSVGAWIVFLDTRTNRRHVARYERLMRSRFPTDGRVMRAWLRAPSGPIAALSFWSDVDSRDLVRRSVTPRRVRPTDAERRERESPPNGADRDDPRRSS
jgi:transcriptional regulator with XRE-family HTH domain